MKLGLNIYICKPCLITDETTKPLKKAALSYLLNVAEKNTAELSIYLGPQSCCTVTVIVFKTGEKSNYGKYRGIVCLLQAKSLQRFIANFH